MTQIPTYRYKREVQFFLYLRQVRFHLQAETSGHVNQLLDKTRLQIATPDGNGRVFLSSTPFLAMDITTGCWRTNLQLGAAQDIFGGACKRQDLGWRMMCLKLKGCHQRDVPLFLPLQSNCCRNMPHVTHTASRNGASRPLKMGLTQTAQIFPSTPSCETALAGHPFRSYLLFVFLSPVPAARKQAAHRRNHRGWESGSKPPGREGIRLVPSSTPPHFGFSWSQGFFPTECSCHW